MQVFGVQQGVEEEGLQVLQEVRTTFLQTCFDGFIDNVPLYFYEYRALYKIGLSGTEPMGPIPFEITIYENKSPYIKGPILDKNPINQQYFTCS